MKMVPFTPNRTTKHDPRQEAGFALLEVIVAMVIMALVGLMAWRGMDALIRGREAIDRHARDEVAYMQLVRQFDRDCQEMVRPDELSASPLTNLASGISSVATANTASIKESAAVNSAFALPLIAVGVKSIWWLRHYRLDNPASWLLIGYRIGPAGLQRLTSPPLSRRADALALWSGIARDPDLVSTDLVLSYEVPMILRQQFAVQAAHVSTLAASDQQGLRIQWWLRDFAFPISRSCLMGGSL